MTSKELLYIEDALAHETFFKQRCQETAQNLGDQELAAFVTQMQNQHQQLFNQLYNLI